MKKAIRDLLSSKKAITTVVGLAVAISARYGFDVDRDFALAILGAFAVLVGAQGVTDAGKEAAKIKADMVTIDLGPVTNETVNGGKRP
jgi:acid phosphatase family membrane protein YuiD